MPGFLLVSRKNPGICLGFSWCLERLAPENHYTCYCSARPPAEQKGFTRQTPGKTPAKTWRKLGFSLGTLGNTSGKPGFSLVETSPKPQATGRRTRFSPGKSQAFPRGNACLLPGEKLVFRPGHQANTWEKPGVCRGKSSDLNAKVRFRENQEPPRTVAPVEKITF